MSRNSEAPTLSMERELETSLELGRRAGSAVLAHYGTVAVDSSGGAPVTEADHAANRVITEGLRSEFPGDAILSEESRDSAARLQYDRVWIVDPLDGTREFLARNGEFSVMIGLAIRGEPVVGVVYRPDGDVLYAAARGAGAWIERGGSRKRLRCEREATPDLRLVGSRSHPDPLLARMQDALEITDVDSCGSVGVKCGRIAEGQRDLYIHPVPHLKEWDTCAPEIVLREAGGTVTDCLGQPLRYNKAVPIQPHGMVACGPAVLDRVIGRITMLYHEAAATAEPAT